MGATITRIVQAARWLGIFLVIALAVAASASAQRPPRKSPHGPLNIPCENCHTATGWSPIRAIPEFNHDTTRYPLRGMHEKVACTGCHVKPVFTDVGHECANCHADIHKAQFGTNCAQCHTVAGWQVSVQAISQHFNRFPLLGAHAVVQCDECHKNAAAGDYLGLSTACESCHMSDFRQTTNPAHAAIAAGTGPLATQFQASNCTGCHNFDSWFNAKFDHSVTGFPLTNGHANVACAQCHIGNNYNLTTQLNDCGNSGCHLTTWQQTNNPPHASSPNAFPLGTCSTCHNTVSWNTTTFDHSTTGFPLTLGHAISNCAQCHINNNYNLKIAATDCGNSACHLTTWQGTNNPVHSTSGAAFAASNCATCHNTASWTTAIFDHSTTAFPLQGAHTVPPRTCTDTGCHVGNNFAATLPTTCYGCHTTDYNNTGIVGHYTDNPPNHVTSGFSTTCTQCHNMNTWTGAAFNHNAFFALTNAHAVPPLTCVNSKCHVGGNYATVPTACSGCHLDVYNQTATMGGNIPNHVAAGFPMDCTLCHDTVLWTDATFNHSTTAFPLQGAHTVPPRTCTDSGCHLGGNYTTLPTTCYGCHTVDYNNTGIVGHYTDNPPNHVAASFPTACTTCHNVNTWTTAAFDHNTTAFPLTGSHTVPPRTCTDVGCHAGGNYTSLPTTCYGCHTTDFNNTGIVGHYTDNPPNHVTAGFSTTCTQCHNTTAWTGATFNHNTFFALTNAHAVPPLTCVNSKCHVGGNYTTVPTACSGCHMDAYNSTVSIAGIPNHVAAQFPMDCTLCHDTIHWTDAVFNHNTTTFPLTGSHTVPPRTCTDVGCHNTGNYLTLPTTCDGCHDALYVSTQNMGAAVPPVPNHVALAYPKTCESCHNTTAWTGALFNHASTGFALNGLHASAACNLCHTSAAVPPIDCYSCHAVQWQSTTSLGGLIPNHVAAALISSSGFSTSTTACVGCHTANALTWTGATFTHSWFNQQHGNSGGVCTICHTNANDYTVFQCTGCHGNNNSANFNHPKLPNYVYNSINCYACHSRG